MSCRKEKNQHTQIYQGQVNWEDEKELERVLHLYNQFQDAMREQHPDATPCRYQPIESHPFWISNVLFIREKQEYIPVAFMSWGFESATTPTGIITRKTQASTQIIYLSELFVSPDRGCRRRGLASMLVSQLVSMADKKQMPMYLLVSSNDSGGPAQKLYSKFQFRDVRDIPDAETKMYSSLWSAALDSDRTTVMFRKPIPHGQRPGAAVQAPRVGGMWGVDLLANQLDSLALASCLDLQFLG